jgi:hypothetical protein
MADKIHFEDYPILRRLDNGAEIKAGWRGGIGITWPECPSDRFLFGLVVEGDTAPIVSEMDTYYLFVGNKSGSGHRPAYEIYGIARAGLAVCRETSPARIVNLVDVYFRSCVYHEHWEDR